MVKDCSGGSRGGGGCRTLPFFLDQNEARRAKKNFIGDRAPLIPLSASSDQDQFPPNDIHTLAREKVMRINISESVGPLPPPLSEGLDPPLDCDVPLRW